MARSVAVRSLAVAAAVAVVTSACVGVALLGLAAPARAGAASVVIQVTTADDVVDGSDGLTSVREAFQQVSDAPGSVDFRMVLAIGATYDLTDCAAGELARLQEHVGNPTLFLQGRGSTIRQTCAGDRVLLDDTAGDLVLADLTITGGDATGDGGGVRSPSAYGVYLIDTTVTGNRASGSGGGVHSGAGVQAFSSVISDNHAATGAGGGVHGALTSSFVQSSIVENTAATSGGGAYVGGVLELDDSTVGGNAAPDGAGFDAHQPVLARSTVHDNAAGPTGASAIARSAVNPLTARGTVIAARPGDGEDCDLGTSSLSNGFNYTSDTTCGLADATDREGNGVPTLAPLADNGAASPSYLPVPGPGPTDLIDAVPSGAGWCPSDEVDQRGVQRPQGSGCEVGAIEVPDPFPDVDAGNPFYRAIAFMDAEGISAGYVDGTYRPSASVTRQAMSAFLYRFEGSLPFTPPASPSFDDVSPSHPFYAEVEWMADEGISDGYGDGTYRPDAPVTRQAMAAFLERLEGYPFTPPATPTFSDATGSHPFYAEIEWMADAGISEGYADGTWRPSRNVSRQAMAQLLYRTAVVD